MPEGKPTIKIKARDLRDKTSKELKKMKEKLEVHNMNRENQAIKRTPNFNPIQVRKNIARINTILKQRGEK